MPKGYTYILLCSDNSYYTGSTINLKKRWKEHLAGQGANHTRKHPPVRILYYEVYPRVDYAFYREKQIQKWSRAKKEALISGRMKDLHLYSQCQNETHYLLR
ncbi:GIY-YIG nuclease family protein [Dokdonia sinensis]|uniref:GIY-YIG nuclease family protein n=1 Tax=Dokdonia sinensis TaxID=2479847 RepID=A0A3M0GLD7_9FLAO|nr:GIY-YIG nuclease family protein [Dokdonia sinensis]RMB63492.1 GIY-YIG nuclease family protein [Dokdonia sinensis]